MSQPFAATQIGLSDAIWRRRVAWARHWQLAQRWRCLREDIDHAPILAGKLPAGREGSRTLSTPWMTSAGARAVRSPPRVFALTPITGGTVNHPSPSLG